MLTTTTEFKPLVDMNSKKAALPEKTRKRLGKQLTSLPTFFDTIPLDQLFSILKSEGLTPVQEDGTEWSGFLCGAQGQVSFPLVLDRTNVATALAGGVTSEEKVLVRPALQMSWYKMGSGRYEIVSYVM